MADSVIRVQHLYVNSMKRRAAETTSCLTVAIPPGVLSCKDDGEYFQLQVLNFTLPMKWPWITAANNALRISPNGGVSWLNVAVPTANYLSFQAMIRAANIAIGVAAPGCSLTYDANTNRVTVTLPNAAYAFNPMTIAPILGFASTTYSVSTSHTSPNQCVPFPTTQLNLCVDGVTPIDQNHGTAVSTVTEPVNYIVSLPMQTTAPGDVIVYTTNAMDIFYLKIKEKDITYLILSLKDENDALFTAADADPNSEYNCVLRVDTVRRDSTQLAIQRAIESAVDYLRLIFVGPHLGASK